MTDIINEEENTDSLPEEEQESVVVDNGQTYASSETAVIAQQAAEQAKLWAQESERQANLSSGSATTAVDARDDAIEAKEYAEAAITDTNMITVATDLQSTPSNIKTVATNISDVNTVAGVSSAVTTVADISSDVTTVSSNSSNVTTVATSISNVNKVGNDISNVNSVADDLTNIDNVAGDLINIDTVAGVSSEVSTVAGISNNVTTVAGISSNVSAVAGNASNINAVAGISTAVSTVADNDTNITTVATNISDISTTATNISAINTNAENITDIQNASNNAALAKQYAVGLPTEPQEKSAKWWAEHSGLPDQTGQSGKVLMTDGLGTYWGQSAADGDGITINTNNQGKTQAIGVIDSNNTTNAIKTWTGTKAQYNAIASKDPNTLYNITDDTDVSLTILEALYPVGSVYITTANTCPLSALISGSTWELVSSGRVLQGADSGHAAGTTIEAGLPNITGSQYIGATVATNTGCFKTPTTKSGHGSASGSSADVIEFDASQSNSIYGNSTTVQPPAYVVNIYRRTA